MKKNKLLIAIISISIIIAILIVIILVNKKDIQAENVIPYDESYNIKREENKPEEIESSINEKNDYNSFTIKGVTKQELLEEFLQEYIQEALNFPQDAYESLEEEYRNKKFGSLEKYTEYIDNRRTELEEAKLSKYTTSEREGYEESVCIDQNNNYYIFYKKDNMDYQVILDTYTVDIPEFLEKYESANEQKKVGYNIEKFISSINDGDYKFAYNLLDEVFKRNNYQKQEDFESFIKNNFYEKNKVAYNVIEKQGNQFICDLTLINSNNDTEQKDITVIMQLKQKTDFVMSFSIDE